MPIKLPKGFQRRKSSGNALNEVLNPPEPSFRVFERPRGAGKSFDSGHALRKVDGAVGGGAIAPGRPGYNDEEDGELFPKAMVDR